jgi:hypothetical protein
LWVHELPRIILALVSETKFELKEDFCRQ